MTRFRVVRTADSYRISRSKSIERYPAVLGPNGVHREAALYIHELAAWRSQSGGTLYDVELLAQAREKFGTNFDELTILHELCELAGHAQPSTLRNYLDLARIRHAVSRS